MIHKDVIVPYNLANDMWRYSINDREIGGVVFASSKIEAELKIKRKYERDDFVVWPMTDDEYYDSKNNDVFECYGL